MKKIYRLIFMIIFIVIVLFASFSYTVKYKFCTVITQFGKIQEIQTDPGLHFKLPWPIDKTKVYDLRKQYMDSGYTETLTQDKINLILQTYLVWHIEDIEKFNTSIETLEKGQKHLNELVANVKNGVMGNYSLSSLVSTDSSQLRINEISSKIEESVAASALENYGIGIDTLKIKRIGLPEANLISVYNQMTAERQKFISKYLAEGNRDSEIIKSKANAQSAEIIAEGNKKASEIDAQTEKKVAEIYNEAYNKNPALFTYLKKLIALENSVNSNTVLVLDTQNSPFSILEESLDEK